MPSWHAAPPWPGSFQHAASVLLGADVAKADPRTVSGLPSPASQQDRLNADRAAWRPSARTMPRFEFIQTMAR